LPLAAIVTPGTLNVIAVNTTSVYQYGVPQFDFVNQSMSFGDTIFTGDTHSLEASARLQRLSIFTTSGSEIGQIQIPYANASYKLEFFGPAVSCSQAPASLVTIVTPWLQSIEGGAIPWLSFAPALLGNVDPGYNPFNDSNGGRNTIFRDGYNFGASGNQSASLFVSMDNEGSTYSSWPMLECTLYNASYQVDFQFTYPQQNISVIQRTLHEPIQIPANNGHDIFGTPEWAYMNIMDAYAHILVGYTQASRGDFSTVNTMFQITALGSLSVTKGFGNEQVIPILESMFQNITMSLLSDSSFQ
jgi:hypothetical protein